METEEWLGTLTGVGLVILVLLAFWISAVRRNRKFEPIVAEHGLEYHAGDPFEESSPWQPWIGLRVGRRPYRSTTVTGHYNGRAVHAYSLTQRTGSASNAGHFSFNTVGVTLDHTYPFLSAMPADMYEGAFSRWRRRTPPELRLTTAGEAEFDQRFKVVSADHDVARTVLHPDMLRTLLAVDKQEVVDLVGNQLHISSGGLLKPDDVPRRLRLLDTLAGHMPTHLPADD